MFEFAALFSQSGCFTCASSCRILFAITLLIFVFAGVPASSKFHVRVPRAAAVNLLRDRARVPAAADLPPGDLRRASAVVRAGAAKWEAGRTVRAALLFCLIAVAFRDFSPAIVGGPSGDFNIVSYGGFQMSALAGFMLSPDIACYPSRHGEADPPKLSYPRGKRGKPPDGSRAPRSIRSASAPSSPPPSAISTSMRAAMTTSCKTTSATCVGPTRAGSPSIDVWRAFPLRPSWPCRSAGPPGS